MLKDYLNLVYIIHIKTNQKKNEYMDKERNINYRTERKVRVCDGKREKEISRENM
jgi:hypothetical protein